MYLMNKNVDHNGKLYAKGDEIKKGDDGFEALVSAGHADKMGKKDAELSEEQKAELDAKLEAEMNAKLEAEMEAEEKDKKKGRK